MVPFLRPITLVTFIKYPRFETDEEAVMMANRTEYGLASYFYTKDLARAWRIAEELEFGECIEKRTFSSILERHNVE